MPHANNKSVNLSSHALHCEAAAPDECDIELVKKV